MIRHLALTGLATLGLMGCLNNDGPDVPPHDPTFPVTGVVHIDGKPAAAVQVSLVPKDNIPSDYNWMTGSTHKGMTDADGKFQIGTYEHGDGAPAGEYVIAIHWQGSEIGKMQSIPDEPVLDPNVTKINRKYGDPSYSEITATVTAGATTDLGTLELTTTK